MKKLSTLLLSLLKRILFLTVLAALIVGLGFLIALPLWAVATKYPSVYNVFFLCFFVCSILFLVIRKIRRSGR